MMTNKHKSSRGRSSGLEYLAALLVLAFTVQLSVMSGANARGVSVYTVAKVKIDARADNAVIAKQLALKKGPLLALKLVFKKMATFRAYDRLSTLTSADADSVIDGYSVRSERNSSTRYIALLDYNFSRKKLQALFVKKGVPFIDRRSKKQVLMPVFRVADEKVLGKKNGKNWWRAWRTIDLKHALTDTRLYKAKQADHDIWQKIVDGDVQQYALLSDQYATSKLILVDAHLNDLKDRLALRIFGKDHVGTIDYTQEIPLSNGADRSDYETVAKIAFGILEGRWREPQISGDVVAVLTTSLDQDEAASSKRLIHETIFLRVAFRGLRNWQQIKKRLQRIPGVQKMQINSLSPRGADVRLKYPGGINRLQSQLSVYNFAVDQQGGESVLRSLK